MFGDALKKFAAIKEMPIEDLLAMIGKKTGQFAGETAGMVAKNPGKSAAIAGLGGIAGHEMQEDPAMEQQEEMMRAYGIR